MEKPPIPKWKKQYPEAFEREYDPASGLHFNAWVEGEQRDNVFASAP